MARLGDFLLERGACTLEELHQGLENQAIFGGRIGTNLLETGALSEESLAEALGAKFGVPWLAGDDLVCDRSAVALLPPELADRCNAVPYLLSGRKLAVLCIDPSNLGALDEVAFVTNRAVQPIVVTEARLWILLKEIYRIDRHLRAIAVRFGSLRERRATPPRGSAELPDAVTPAGRMRALDPSGGGLVEQDGDELSEETDPAEAAAALAAAANGLGLSNEAGGELAPPDLPSLDLAAPLEPGLPVPPSIQELPAFTRDLLARLALETGRPPEDPLPPDPGLAPAPPPREPTAARPLDHQVALAAIDSAADADSIGRVLIRHARGRFSRALLLRVRGGQAEGWEGSVPGVPAERMRAVVLPLDAPGIVAAAAGSGAPVDGPLAHAEADVALVNALGGGTPQRGAAIPVLAAGRVVDVLYVDRGPGGAHDRYALDEVLVIARAAGRRYDALRTRT